MVDRHALDVDAGGSSPPAGAVCIANVLWYKECWQSGNAPNCRSGVQQGIGGSNPSHSIWKSGRVAYGDGPLIRSGRLRPPQVQILPLPLFKKELFKAPWSSGKAPGCNPGYDSSNLSGVFQVVWRKPGRRARSRILFVWVRVPLPPFLMA